MAEVGAYRDHRFGGAREKQDHMLKNTATLYVGNLSFYTTEEQVHELFSKVGDVKRIIMGLDKQKKTPCGFALSNITIEKTVKTRCDISMAHD